MGFFDRLFGRKEERPQAQGPVRFGDGPATSMTNTYGGQGRYGTPRTGATTQLSPDEQAVARYRYLLQTAPPEQIEQAHAEAFATMTPQQRAMVLQGLSQHVPAYEQQQLAAAQNDPQAMARYATRAEMRQPGTLERAFGGGYGNQGGMMGGMGGMIAGSLLASVAGAFIGTAIADAMLSDFGDPLAEEMPAEDMAMEEPVEEPMSEDFGGDFGGDMGGFEEF
jgi:hypothetical protein